MAEYIEREAACKDCIHYDVCYHIEHYGRETETDEPCKKFKSADVVEVVRCRDCEKCVKKDNFMYCEEHSDGWGDYTAYVDPDDYCSYGERMSDNG